MSTGFLVILAIASLLVALPTILVMRVVWHGSRFKRIVAVAAIAVVMVLAVVFLTPAEWPNSLEERAVVFLAVWGILLYLSLIAALLATAGRKLWALCSPENLP